MLGESMMEPIKTGIKRDGVIMINPMFNSSINRVEYNRMLHLVLMLLLRKEMFKK